MQFDSSEHNWKVFSEMTQKAGNKLEVSTIKCDLVHNYIETEQTTESDITFPDSWTGQCVKDSSSRVLPEVNSWHFPNMTRSKCIEACLHSGFSFAGVQHGDEGWCGHVAPPADIIVPMTECDMACLGDSTENCGGFWRMNVFEVQQE